MVPRLAQAGWAAGDLDGGPAQLVMLFCVAATRSTGPGDLKVTAVNRTWSGPAFARKKRCVTFKRAMAQCLALAHAHTGHGRLAMAPAVRLSAEWPFADGTWPSARHWDMSSVGWVRSS
jgi:hypothetical protein